MTFQLYGRGSPGAEVKQLAQGHTAGERSPCSVLRAPGHASRGRGLGRTESPSAGQGLRTVDTCAEPRHQGSPPAPQFIRQCRPRSERWKGRRPTSACWKLGRLDAGLRCTARFPRQRAPRLRNSLLGACAARRYPSACVSRSSSRRAVRRTEAPPAEAEVRRWLRRGRGGAGAPPLCWRISR